MTPWPLNPRMAWFSGYRIPYETWCQWTLALPVPEDMPGLRISGTFYDATAGIRNGYYYLSAYIVWKESLPLKNRRKMPRPQIEYENDTTVSVFFPVRWVGYSSENQVIPGKRGYDERICKERESDRAQFQYFLKFVELQGAPLDEEKAEFGWKKDIDPHDDWRAY